MNFLSVSQALGMNNCGNLLGEAGLKKERLPEARFLFALASLSVPQGTDRAVPVLIIGILVFLPGFYHLRIAYYASKGYRGYSYDDIPDFDD